MADEVHHAIKLMKNNEAARQDSLPVDVLKLGREYNNMLILSSNLFIKLCTVRNQGLDLLFN